MCGHGVRIEPAAIGRTLSDRPHPQRYPIPCPLTSMPAGPRASVHDEPAVLRDPPFTTFLGGSAPGPPVSTRAAGVDSTGAVVRGASGRLSGNGCPFQVLTEEKNSVAIVSSGSSGGTGTESYRRAALTQRW